MKLELSNIVFLFILIHSPLRKCNSDSDNARDKRTVGVFFRSFVDAFQTQRQPAPTVISFKPPRQSFPIPLPQSVKSDIFSSSKNLFQQKQNLLKPAPTTQAPATETIATTPPPAASPPSAPTEPLSQAPINQSQDPIPNLPQPVPLDPSANLLQPSGHHPFAPLKAQILILPFQGHHGPETPFPGFGPQFPGGISPFNYQAEIFLHPPSNGVFAEAGHYPGRYSPDKGWHDVDDILSKGIQTQNKKVEKEEVRVENLTKLKGLEFNKYEANIDSQTVGTKLIEHPNSKGSLPYRDAHSHENEVEGHRRDGYDQNGQYNYLPSHPLFSPHLLTHSDCCRQPFGNIYGNFNFDDQNHEFQQLIDDAYKKFSSEGLKNVPVEPQTTAVPQSTQDRARVNDAGVLQTRGNTGHDYTPQRGVKSKTKENPHPKSYNQQNYEYDHERYYPDQGNAHYSENKHISYPQNGYVQLPEYFQLPEHNIHYPEHSNTHPEYSNNHPEYSNTHSEYDHVQSSDPYSHYNNHNEKNYLQNDQHHMKIGKPSDSYQKPQKQHEYSPTAQNQHQEPSHDTNLDQIEFTDSHPNGYYHFKRSYIAKRHN